MVIIIFLIKGVGDPFTLEFIFVIIVNVVTIDVILNVFPGLKAGFYIFGGLNDFIS